MILQLDQYRKSKSRALVDSYYAQPSTDEATQKRAPATIVQATWCTQPQPPETGDGGTTPGNAGV